MIRYIDLISQKSESEQLDLKAQEQKSLDFIQLEHDAQYFISEYKEYDEIVDLHENLLNSISFAEKAHNNVITLLQYLDKSGEYSVSEEDAVIAQQQLEENKKQRSDYLDKFDKSFSELTTKYGVKIGE